MPGGEMQLSAVGSENQYLNGNPQMTYFRTVYRRYTNFSMEMVRINLRGPNELSATKDITLQCRIPRNGDLLSQIFLVFDLPDIFSGYDPFVTKDNVRYSAHHFQWIRNIGCHIVKHATLKIGPTTINKVYGEWIAIWHELFSPFNTDVFNEMVGNLPELYDPASAPGSGGIYPNSTLKAELDEDPDLFTASEYLQNPFHKPPSIRGRRITVPIPLYFSTNPGLALPLVSLQYHEVFCTLELRKITELYTLIETSESSPDFGKRVRPVREEQLIHNFITTLEPTEGVVNLTQDTDVKGWGVDMHLDANYIFLEKIERDKFAATSHEYLIEQVQRHEFLGVYGTKNLHLKLQHPVKALVWMAVKDVHRETNNFGNYTNWADPNLSPGSLEYLRNNHEEVFIDRVTGQVIDHVAVLADTHQIATKYNFNWKGKRDIVQQATVLFNGVQRFNTRDQQFFALVQNYQHKMRSLPGVMTYSFSLEPSKAQPSGACNMSRVKDVQLQLEMLNVPMKTGSDNNGAETLQHEYKFDVYVYTISYNLLRILAGMGGLGYQ